MNIKKMLEAQKELDQANFVKGGITEYPLQEIKTAYRVELGELLNEWQGFKYWKANKVIDRDKMVEEWADCMHFALSLTREENIISDDYEVKNISNDIEVFEVNKIIEFCFAVNTGVLLDTIALGLKLGFTLEELEQAYWNKYKINWERVNNGY